MQMTHLQSLEKLFLPQLKKDVSVLTPKSCPNFNKKFLHAAYINRLSGTQKKVYTDVG